MRLYVLLIKLNVIIHNFHAWIMSADWIYAVEWTLLMG